MLTQSTRLHYGWIVVAVTAAVLLVVAGVRSAPGVLMHPLEDELGWSRAAISFAASIGLLLYGLVAPGVGVLVNRYGLRWLMLTGLVLTGASTLLAAAMTTVWQLNLFWGVFNGLGTGLLAVVLGAAVANRWFTQRRGLVVGIFGAATSAGQLVFVPLLMWLVATAGWRQATVLLALAALALLAPVLLLMRESPAAVGLQPYGGPPPATETGGAGVGVMARAVRAPEFWLLAGSFFICGATSTGLIGIHFIPHSLDHGIPEATAAGALALMGAMNFVGTITSGWLTDRFDPRKLLAWYYTFRGLSLLVLPFVTDFSGLAIFAILFGLDYIATVPPTSVLAADLFGRRHVGIVFGWVFAAHQFGAATAAYLGGVARDTLGDYQLAFLSAGALAMIGGLMALRISRPLPIPAPA